MIRFLGNFGIQNLNRTVSVSRGRFYSLSQTPLDSSSSQNIDFTGVSSLDVNKVKKTSKKVSTKTEDDSIDKHELPVSDVVDSQDRAVVLRKPIPKNFIKETLLPHLEHNVAYNCMKFPPDVVLQIGIAYSKLPHFIRQRSIEDALVETFRHRMVDYTAPDCIQLLNTCLQLQGLRSVSIYDDIISRLEVPHVYNSINSLNRLGICRSISKIIRHSQKLTDPSVDSQSGNQNQSSKDDNVYNNDYESVVGSTKMSRKHIDDLKVKDLFKVDFNFYNDKYTTSPIRPWSYLVKNYRDKRIGNLVERLVNFCENRILPQLEYELKSFDSDELTDLLAVLAQRTERDGSILDFPVISILMSNIMRLYPSTSLVNTLNNLSSLCRLKIRHDGFLSLVLNDLRNPLKVSNIYHKHLSRCIWSLARYDLLNEVLNDLLEHVGRNVPKFGPSCFARLSQVSRYYLFSEEKKSKTFNNQIHKTVLCLLTRLDSLAPKDLIFFVSGLMHMKLLPTRIEHLENTPRPIKPKFDKEDRYLSKNSKSSDTFQVLSKVLYSLKTSDTDFDLWEIERLVDTTKAFEEYEYLLDHFPESWRNIINPAENPA